MKLTKYTVLFALIVALLLAAGGCGKRADSKKALSYTERAFDATVSGEANGVKFEALVSAAEPRENSLLPRDVSITFYAPASMSGVVLTRESGKLSLALGDLTLDAEYADGWIDIATALLPDGAVSDVTPLADRPSVVTVAFDDPARTITVDLSTGSPIAAAMTSPRKLTLNVIAFSGAT
ncbi:MAG: hypothetical protein IJY27_07940 [Clostridia bacterium]|nr:hypothetical protein [Clostridia bacterium]